MNLNITSNLHFCSKVWDCWLTKLGNIQKQLIHVSSDKNLNPYAHIMLLVILW